MHPLPVGQLIRSRFRGLRLSRFVAIALAALLLACSDDSGPAPAPRPPKPTATPSIVLVDVSGLARDDVFPQSGEPRAKAVREFMDGATSFSQAAATSSGAIPSLASVMSGYSPRDAGVEGRDPAPLVDPIETIAEMLAREGYETSALVAGDRLTTTSGLLQGFEHVSPLDDDLAAARAALESLGRAAASGASAPRPQFVFVFVPVGGAAAAEKDARRLAALSLLAQKPTPKNGLLTIVCSDHGEPTGTAIPAGGSMGLLSDARIRVPLAIRGDRFAAGEAKGSCSLADVLPTIRDLMGLPERGELAGRSLLPLAADRGSAGRPVFAEAWRPKSDAQKGACLFGLRSARAKFVAIYTTDPAEWTPEVFDLEQDPAEAHPEPAPATSRFGADFQRAVDSLSNALSGRADSSNSNEIVKPYVRSGSGPCGGH